MVKHVQAEAFFDKRNIPDIRQSEPKNEMINVQNTRQKIVSF